jgi:CSLREA domain-containing protein
MRAFRSDRGHLAGARLAALLLGLLAPASALAADFTVDTTADLSDVTPGDGYCDTNSGGTAHCSLRAALMEANGQGGGPHNITLPAGTYTLTRTGDDDMAAVGDLDVAGGIRIVGAGPSTTIVQACDAVANPNCTGIDRVFDVRPGESLNLSGATVRKGNTSGPDGGIRAEGELTVTGAVLDGNVAHFGGGLVALPDAMVSLTNVAVTNNRAAEGGGIENLDGALTLTNVILSRNTATAFSGGGLVQTSGGSGPPIATLANVTVTHNQTTVAGAGLCGGSAMDARPGVTPRP